MTASQIPETSTTLLRDMADPGHARWSVFYSRYQPMMLAYLRERFPSLDAEDIVQETFLALAKIIPDYRYDPERKGAFHNFLTGVLRNKALCALDKAKRQMAVEARMQLTVTVNGKSVHEQRFAGFGTGSYKDLERAVEKKLGIAFGYDIIRKGSVSQKIGNLENTEGETLRYFVGEIGEGEDLGRSVRKAINQHALETDPLNGGFGAALANAFEDAMQADENRKNANDSMFQPQGSLQLLLTPNAVKGTFDAKGSFGKISSLGGALKAAGELDGKLNELKSATDALKNLTR